jgi:hypothetical protein
MINASIVNMIIREYDHWRHVLPGRRGDHW